MAFGAKACLKCKKIMSLKLRRDIKRKKFCSHSCRASYYVCLNLLGKPPTEKQRHTFDKWNSEHKREKSLRWKGGRYTKSGYPYINSKTGPVLEHRLVAKEILGRELTRKDVVHHIDGDKLNNAKDNLWIGNQSDHIKLHQSLERIAYKLVKEKKIVFNKEGGGSYSLQESRSHSLQESRR